MHLMATNEDANDRCSAEPLEYRIHTRDDSKANKRPAPYPSPIPIQYTFQDDRSSSGEHDGRSQGRTKLVKISNDHHPGSISQFQKANNTFWYNDDRPSPVSQVRNKPKPQQRPLADVGSPAVNEDDASPSSSSSDEPPKPQEYQQPFPLQQLQPWGNSSSDEHDGRSQGKTKSAKISNDHRQRPASHAQKANDIFWYNDDRPSPVSQVRNKPKTPQWPLADVGSPTVNEDGASPSSSSSDEPPKPQEYQQPFPLQQPQPWGMYPPPHPSMGPNAAWHYATPGAYPYPVHQDGCPPHGGPHPQPPTMPPSYHYPYANGWFAPPMPYSPHAGHYMPAPYIPQPMNTPTIPPTSHELHNPTNVAFHPGVQSRVRPPVMLYAPNDDETLSDYQVFVRKQIEFFEADTYEVDTPKPGRKKPIVLGQVGIRCKHCRDVLIARRMPATVYFPSKLRGLYQAAQNIASTHLDKCPNMSESLKRSSSAFQSDSKRASAGRGGKQYWADAAKALGIVESQDRLRFAQ